VGDVCARGTFHDFSTGISIPLTEFSDLLGDSPGIGWYF
jgi:hypothetical protein